MCSVVRALRAIAVVGIVQHQALGRTGTITAQAAPQSCTLAALLLASETAQTYQRRDGACFLPLTIRAKIKSSFAALHAAARALHIANRPLRSGPLCKKQALTRAARPPNRSENRPPAPLGFSRVRGRSLALGRCNRVQPLRAAIPSTATLISDLRYAIWSEPRHPALLERRARW